MTIKVVHKYTNILCSTVRPTHRIAAQHKSLVTAFQKLHKTMFSKFHQTFWSLFFLLQGNAIVLMGMISKHKTLGELTSFFFSK